jgi:hypothetical protein
MGSPAEVPVYEFADLQRMTVESLDQLPWPAEAQGQRLNWVGIGIVNEGPAEGTETMRVIDSREADHG